MPICWPTTARCSRRNAARSARSSPPSGEPSATISPSSGAVSPASRPSSVVLPEPDGPVSASIVPAGIVRSRRSNSVRACTPLPTAFVTPRTSIATSPAARAAARRGLRRPARPRPPPPAGVTTIPLAVQARVRARADPGAQQQLLGQPQPAAAADDDRLLAPVLAAGHALAAHAPVAHADDAVRDRGHGRVVRDDDGGAALLAHEVGEQVVGEHRVLAVELAGRLVGQQQLRPVGQRGAHGDALLLAARELRRPRLAAVAEPDALEQLVRAGQALPSRRARERRLERDQLARAEVRVERAPVVLLDVAEHARAVLGAPAAGPARRGRGRTRAASRRTAARARRAGAAASTCPSRSGRGSR